MLRVSRIVEYMSRFLLIIPMSCEWCGQEQQRLYSIYSLWCEPVTHCASFIMNHLINHEFVDIERHPYLQVPYELKETKSKLLHCIHFVCVLKTIQISTPNWKAYILLLHNSRLREFPDTNNFVLLSQQDT